MRGKSYGGKGREREGSMGNNRKGERRQGGPRARQILGMGRKDWGEWKGERKKGGRRGREGEGRRGLCVWSEGNPTNMYP
jgi:hypothetical protein